MTLDELLALTELPDRTLRHWTQNGVLPPTRDAGGYTAEHVNRIFAAFRLQKEGIRQLKTIAARLDAMSPAALERFANHEDAGEDAAPGTAAILVAPAAVAVVEAPALDEPWTHITLRPGLILQMRAGASEEVTALVQAIRAMCDSRTGLP